MIIDSHCHLQDPKLDDSRSVVTRSIEQQVWGIVAVGSDPESNLRTLAVAALNGKMVWPALGFHPELTRLTDEDLALVESQVGQHHSRLVALGEVGLPWYSLDGAARVYFEATGDPEGLLTVVVGQDAKSITFGTKLAGISHDFSVSALNVGRPLGGVTAIPEPGSAILFAIGGMVVSAAVRRRED